MSTADPAPSPILPGRFLLLGACAIALVSVGYAIYRNQGEQAKPAAPAPEASGGAPAPDAQAILRSLQERVGANPKDAESWQKLGWLYFETGRYADAARAYRRATELTPRNATFWSSLGEALVMADERNPMPDEAARAFATALRLDPKDPRARYFDAVRKDLSGEHKGAIEDWLALLKDTPPGAPWEKDLRRTIEQAGRINHIDVTARLASIAPPPARPSIATAAMPGPSRQQMQDAANLPKAEQDAMIAGMVGRLESKLKAEPGNVTGWIMLMRSRMTLGESAKAAAALKAAIAANRDQEQYLRGQAAQIGVPGA